MKVIIAIFMLFLYVQLGLLQQCRQVCEYDVPGSGAGAEKGDIGAPGKAGPSGNKGEKGEVGGGGTKGRKGDACALGGFEEELRRELADLKLLLRPTSCSTSPIRGRQTLRLGEEAFCEDGWTVFQKRFDGSVDFERTWNEFESGFGDLIGEFWLGLESIYNLTRSRKCQLQIDLEAFDGDTAYARYSSFYIEGASDHYRLRVSGYTGTAGDSLSSVHNNMQFTSFDADHDSNSANCAVRYRGGWWYGSCHDSSLNSPWGESTGRSLNIVWGGWKGHDIALKKTTMKLRCD